MAVPHYPKGAYGVQVVSQKLCKNERTDNYQVVIEFEPLRLENTAAPEDSPDRWQPLPVESFSRRLYLSLTERAAPITADKLERLGIVFDDWAKVDGDHPECISIVGEKRRLTCCHETWKGQVREKWDVPFAGAGNQDSLDAGEAAQVQAMFGHLAKGAGDPAAPAQPEEPAAATAPAGRVSPSGDENIREHTEASGEESDDLRF